MKNLNFIIFLLTCTPLFAQDANVLFKVAENLEYQLKEKESLEKYKQVIMIDPRHLPALIRASELTSGLGSRASDKKTKQVLFEQAKSYADRALQINSNNADANYVRAVVAGKLTETESENKKIVGYVKEIKEYADKAIAINPNHARANYVLGKWHVEMVNLSWPKKAAVKVFFGGLPDANMEDAIKYMERSRALDKYFVLNHLELAKAYKSDNKPAKAIEILKLLVRLPARSADDPAFKAEGNKILQDLL